MTWVSATYATVAMEELVAMKPSLPRETPRMVGIGLRNPINTTVGG